MNLRHLKHSTVNYWMVLSSYTACPSLELQHSKNTERRLSSLIFRVTHREKKGWTLYGTQTIKFKEVDSSEEREGGPQKGIRGNQVTRRLVRLSA